jgi:hypothetical protein
MIDSFQPGFQPGFQAISVAPVSVGASSGVGAGIYDRTAYNRQLLAALNAAQLERRKEADEIYAAALAHNAQVQRERRAAALERRQREEEWLLGLITTDEFIAA